MAVEESAWMRIVGEDPDHSRWYIQRFRDMAAEGVDLAGEARMIDAMAARGARILDAGCGPGRVGAALHAAGHVVVGVDVDPALVAAAEADHPGPTWLVGDLAELHLLDGRLGDPFDLIVCAGNVMTFLAPSTRRAVLAGFTAHLAVGGRAVVGFGAGRDYEFGDFEDDCAASGLDITLRLGTWDLQPFTGDSDFLVAVLEATDRGGAS